MHICSGCDNECEIGEQYCLDCLREIAQDDWEESHDVYFYPCEHSWVERFDGSQSYVVCEICGEYRD